VSTPDGSGAARNRSKSLSATGTGITAAVVRNFNDADWLSILARLAGGDALSPASPSSVSAGSDAAASDVNAHTWSYAAFHSDSGNNSHRFIAGFKTVAVMNGCKAVSALLSAKWSSRAARRSRLKLAMVGESSAHSSACSGKCACVVCGHLSKRFVSSESLSWPAYALCTPEQCGACKDCRGFYWQTSEKCRSACGTACTWSASHKTGVALTVC